ncbi:DUF2256 and DUF3253 domain-containing protein [Kineosporia rhizophila]|uniref:DUF2256 and DUF3253 domain-containing protein n=1 Tax=Kineosporia TaxID=49184 RepID=UPI001E4AE7AE|nr:MULTISPECIES: DUF2256 and DUF3253 domain-containing protein [Kineosporia]MCE0538078.1 DUF2256 and DUF3253 domain-containing protein [Kineosporia rhizophila]GLY14905.1 hypothetical protein Kisp01_19200 [Kineosporia sp. NBRC 101677]
MGSSPTKVCASCGRTIAWRKKWAANWDEIRYCSQACRRTRVGDVGRRLEGSILELVRHRARGAGVDPSEALRSLGLGDEQQYREAARAAARRLVAAGQVEIVQNGRVVDPSRAKGAFLVRSVPSGPRSA